MSIESNQNINEEKNPVGRPPLFSDPLVLQEKIEEYFEKGLRAREVIVGPPNNRKVIMIKSPTITGLILYCGFSHRSSFYEYEKQSEFTDTIKKARSRIEEQYENLLQDGLGAGAIFALKNFGWKDESGLSLSGHNGGSLIPEPFNILPVTTKSNENE